MNSYTIWMSTPRGEPIAILDSVVRLEYRRVVNQTGYYTAVDVRNILPLRLVVQADALPLSRIERDSWLQIWRTVEGRTSEPRTQQLETETTWFVRQIRTRLTPDGQRLVELGAVPAIDLLNSRIVAYAAGSLQATKDGPVDDLMKTIVLENLSTLATESSRSINDWLGIAPNLGQGPTVRKSFARRNLFTVLRELAETASELGTRVSFDIVNVAPDWLVFQTYIGARGADNTFSQGRSPVVLSPETGTLASVVRSFDYEDEYTVVYAAGQGAEAERQLVVVSDPKRIAASPFGRRERLLDARHITNPADLTAEAQATLEAGRPRQTFQATVVSQPGMAYGQHWRWGDRVTAVVDGEVFQCLINEIRVTISGEREEIQAWLQTDDTAPTVADGRQEPFSPGRAAETEVIYQQVQRGSLPATGALAIPPDGHLLAYGRYVVGGQLTLNTGSRLVILT